MGTANITHSGSLQGRSSFVIPCMDSYETGTKRFADLVPDLNAVKTMLDEMIAIADSLEDIPPAMASAIDLYINDFSNVANYITLYEIEGDTFVDTDLRGDIAEDINNWITSIYTGHDIANRPYGFLPLYNALKFKALMAGKTEFSVLDRLKAEIKLSVKKSQELLSLLHPISEPLSPYDYSNMLQQQAMQRSRLKVAKKSSNPVITVLQFMLIAFLVYAVGYILIVFYR